MVDARVLAIAFVVSLLLAGCAAPDEPAPDLEVPAFDTDLEARFNATHLPQGARASGDDWLLLSTATSPQGGVAAFEWQRPKNVGGTFGPLRVLDLEIAPVVDGPLRMDQEWALFVFHERDGQVHFYRSLLEPAGRETETPPASGWVDRAPGAQPRIFNVGVPESDTYHLVLAAKGNTGETFGIGVRPLLGTRGDEGFPEPSESFDAFLARQNNPVPYVPARTGTGSGLQLATYGTEMRERVRYDFAGGSMHVDEIPVADAWPVASVKDLTLSSAWEHPGWARASVFVHGWGAGEWSIEATAYGEEIASSGIFLGGPYIDAAMWIIYGPRGGSVSCQGDGESHVTVNIDAARLHAADGLAVTHEGLGVNLTDLFGKPVACSRFAWWETDERTERRPGSADARGPSARPEV